MTDSSLGYRLLDHALERAPLPGAWLSPDGGKAVVHVFSHRLPYLVEGT